MSETIYIYNSRFVAMCGHEGGLRGRTDGLAGTSNPATERRDGLHITKCDKKHCTYVLFYSIPILHLAAQAVATPGVWSGRVERDGVRGGFSYSQWGEVW